VFHDPEAATCGVFSLCKKTPKKAKKRKIFSKAL